MTLAGPAPQGAEDPYAGGHFPDPEEPYDVDPVPEALAQPPIPPSIPSQPAVPANGQAAPPSEMGEVIHLLRQVLLRLERLITAVERPTAPPQIATPTQPNPVVGGAVPWQTPGSQAQIGAAVPTSHPQGWLCPAHGGVKFVPAGVSKKSGKPYQGFWACPERGCDEKPAGQ